MRRVVVVTLSGFFSLIASGAEATIELSVLTADSPVTYSGASVYYNKEYDICGLCDGDSTSCQGCDGFRTRV